MADFVKNFGFSLKPGTQNEGREILIDDARYESEWLDGDFNRFINGGNATNAGSHSVKQTTYANVDDILANKKRMAANNESYRKTA